MLKSKLALLLSLSATLALLAGCQAPSDAPSAGRIGKDRALELNKQAMDMKNKGVTFDEVIATQDKALETLHREGSPSAVRILGQAGMLYFRYGDYHKGLELLNEASDSLNTIPRDKWDIPSVIRLYGNRSNFYSRLGLVKEALADNDKAMALATDTNAYVLPDLWRFRGSIFEKAGDMDSVLRCYDRAIALSEEIPECRKMECRIRNVSYRSIIIIEKPELFPDSVPGTLKALRSVKDSLTAPYDSVSADFATGRGLVLTGHHGAGLAKMEQGLKYFREHDDAESVAYAENLLMKSYALCGDGAAMANLFPSYKAHCDTLAKKRISDAVMGAEFRYRTREKEEELNALKQHNMLSRKTIVLQWIVFVLCIVLLAITAALAYRHYNTLLVQKKKLHQRIDELLNHQKTPS